MVGADKIMGGDVKPAREAMARKFGVTHFIDPKTNARAVSRFARS